MSKFYAFATAAVMSMAALSVSAQEATLTMSPAPGSYETLPAEGWSLTIDGPESIKAGALAGNYITFITQEGKRIGAGGLKLTGNIITFKPQSTVPLDQEGTVTVELAAEKLTYTWADGTTTKNELTNFVYTVEEVLEPYTAKFTIDPAPGAYETMPSEFTVNVKGPVSIKKNITVSNPVKIIAPDGKAQTLPATWDTNSFTVKVPANPNITLDQNGEYIFRILTNGITYVWEDKTTTKAEETDFTYQIEGQGQQPVGPQPVEYDITLKSTTPNLNPFDLSMKTFQTVSMAFSQGDLALDPNANALVTIAGPGYKQTAQLSFNMGNANSTSFKAMFTDPKYNGEYTLTIPQGVLGDAEWIENHEYGHANAAVDYHFTVVGGEDPGDLGVVETFNPIVNPGIGGRITTLDRVSLTFDSTPYFTEGTELNVNYKADLSSTGNGSSFGKASIEKGTDNEIVLVLNPVPADKGQYLIDLPAGTFWDAEHNENTDKGQINAQMDLNWYFVIPVVNITSHIPATDAKVSGFESGEPGIIIDTDDNATVAKMTVEVVRYEIGNDSAAPRTILNATTTDKTEQGAICWINNGETMEFSSNYYYEVNVTLYDAAGNVRAEEMFEFYGDDYVGVDAITVDGSTEYFNLQGVRVANPGKGLYIRVQNGKAVKVVR